MTWHLLSEYKEKGERDEEWNRKRVRVKHTCLIHTVSLSVSREATEIVFWKSPWKRKVGSSFNFLLWLSFPLNNCCWWCFVLQAENQVCVSLGRSSLRKTPSCLPPLWEQHLCIGWVLPALGCSHGWDVSAQEVRQSTEGLFGSAGHTAFVFC